MPNGVSFEQRIEHAGLRIKEYVHVFQWLDGRFLHLCDEFQQCRTCLINTVHAQCRVAGECCIERPSPKGRSSQHGGSRGAEDVQLCIEHGYESVHGGMEQMLNVGNPLAEMVRRDKGASEQHCALGWAVVSYHLGTCSPVHASIGLCSALIDLPHPCVPFQPFFTETPARQAVRTLQVRCNVGRRYPHHPPASRS